MNVQLYSTPNPALTPTQQVMLNRGIPLEDQKMWLEAKEDHINSWRRMGETVVRQGCKLVYEHMKKKHDIAIIADSDCDGFTSAAILINFLELVNSDWAHEHITWLYHAGKQHGFNDLMDDILAGDYKLVISPDGGTNDVAAHKKLHELGIDALVLDHHLIEDSKAIKQSPATIINIQDSEYPNKSLTGAGVVWQFCRAYNELYNLGLDRDIDGMIDLCAIGNIGDMADYRNLETRAIVVKGMKHLGEDTLFASFGAVPTPINPLLRALADKNAYTLNKRGGLNYYSCAFGIVPFINAITRSASDEEEDTFFSGFLTMKAFDRTPSTKRGAKDKLVPMFEESAIVSDRVKRKQTKEQDEALANIEKVIAEEDLLKDNKVLIVPIAADQCRQELVGLVANKLQAKYQRPVLVLRQMIDAKDRHVLTGSGRNYSMCKNQDFKSEVEKTGLTIFQAGRI